MPLTLQTIEELEKRLEANRMPVIDLETHETTQPSGRMLVDIEECEELLAAARWALEAGYGQESDDEIVESPDMRAAKVFMNGFEVTYAKDGESVANNPQHQLLAFLVNHASELLQCAREVEGLKARIEVLENPLPTQEEEREFYHRAYHVCHTGCPMPCPNRT